MNCCMKNKLEFDAVIWIDKLDICAKFQLSNTSSLQIHHFMIDFTDTVATEKFEKCLLFSNYHLETDSHSEVETFWIKLENFKQFSNFSKDGSALTVYIIIIDL